MIHLYKISRIGKSMEKYLKQFDSKELNLYGLKSILKTLRVFL